MVHSIERSGSPLYDAIREVMAGSWPEDEYDVAESPLSYVDYKSQVFFDFDGPVASVVNPGIDGASDTDFESLGSDVSGWGEDVDDTMATEVDVEASGKTDAAGTPTPQEEMLPELFRETDAEKEEVKGEEEEERVVEPKVEENEGREEEEKQEELKANSELVDVRGSSEILRDEILEGPEEATGPEIELTIETRAEGELEVEIEEIFRVEIAAEVDRAFGNMFEDDEIKPENPAPAKVEPEATRNTQTLTERILAGLIIPPLPASGISPVVYDPIEPPPIPSRSPSRPGTSMANRKAVTETPVVFAPQQRCDSSLSLPPARLTVSSLSSPRSSRFFEDLNNPAVTSATSTVASEKNNPTPSLPQSRKGSDDSNIKSSLGKKEKRRTRFFRSCGLESLFKKMKLGEPKKGSKGHPRALSIIKWSEKRWYEPGAI